MAAGLRPRFLFGKDYGFRAYCKSFAYGAEAFCGLCFH